MEVTRPVLIDKSYLTMGAAGGILVTLIVVARVVVRYAADEATWKTTTSYQIEAISRNLHEMKTSLEARRETNEGEIRDLWAALQDLHDRTVQIEYRIETNTAYWTELQRKNPTLNMHIQALPLPQAQRQAKQRKQRKQRKSP